MNRRGFIASLFALPSAIKAACTAKPRIDSNYFHLADETPVRPYTDFEMRSVGLSWHCNRLKTPWIQTKRTSYVTSPEYEDRVATVLEPRGSDKWRAAHRRIIQRRVDREAQIPSPDSP